MEQLDHLSFRFGNRLPSILQTEAAECGLACLAMIASYHGHRVDLPTLRREHSISLEGATLHDIMKVAERLELASRPVRLELQDLGKLRLPCVLHWNFNHFVVLKSVSRGSVTILDPACGERRLSNDELSGYFTGVALELWPNPEFKKVNVMAKVRIRDLMGQVRGLFSSFGQILLLAGAMEVFTIVSPFFLQWVIDNSIVSGDRDLLTTLAVGFGLLAVMKVLVGTVRSWALMHIGATLNFQWRANTFTHLMRLPVQYFQKRHVGDIQSRFGSIDQVQNTVTSAFIEALLDGVMSIVILIMMYVYSPLLATIALCTMVLYTVSRLGWYNSLKLSQHSQILFAAKQETHFLESVRGARTIKLFQREGQRRTTWLSILVDQINAGLNVQRLGVVYGSFNKILTSLEAIVIVYLGARMVIEGKYTVGALMAFKAYNDQFSGRLSAFVDRLFDFQLLKIHGTRLADIVLTEPESAPPNTPQQLNDQKSCSVEVSGVHYRYSEHEPFVLKGINLRIEAGEAVAIVGASGCGKTTLLNVLLGVLTPVAGDVAIGGHSLRNGGLSAARNLIGTVTQDDVLFAGSISDNICFFDNQPDSARIEECSRLASVHDDIASMPMGYDSLVGDMGTILSGGQKQRVLIARALYKSPKVLLLDEATSHLDADCERRVNAAIKDLKITRVIIAHRQETIASADRVVVLRDGFVISDIKTAKTASSTPETAPPPLAPAEAPRARGRLPLAPSIHAPNLTKCKITDLQSPRSISGGLPGFRRRLDFFRTVPHGRVPSFRHATWRGISNGSIGVGSTNRRHSCGCA